MPRRDKKAGRSTPGEDRPGGGPRRPPAAWIPITRFIAITLAGLGGFYMVLRSEWVQSHFTSPYTGVVAASSRVFLKIVGLDVQGTGSLMISPEFAVNILHVCNGLEAIAIFFTTVLAFPAPLKSKMIGLAIGFPAIYVVNIARIAALFIIGAKVPDIFDSVHYYYAQAMVIIITVLLWLAWVTRIVPHETEKPDPDTG